jgi:hypothetical protein
LTDIAGNDAIELKMRVAIDNSASKRLTIDINQMDLAGEGAGPHVVVIDPAAGIVANSAAMPDPSGNITWRMFRLRKPNR